MRYGYIRVSTKEQHIDRQLTALLEYGVAKKCIYIDKQSGKDFNRESYQKLLKKGDELVIKSIDRLGRNYDDVMAEWHTLVNVKEVDMTVLDFPLLNTKNRLDNLTGKLVANLVLQILSYVAQMERDQLKQRQREGITEAKKKGVQFGRPKP